MIAAFEFHNTIGNQYNFRNAHSMGFRKIIAGLPVGSDGDGGDGSMFLRHNIYLSQLKILAGLN
jgi:hypothetical protein